MKKLILNILSRIGCFILRLRGVHTGKGVILSHLPRIKKKPRGTINLGNKVTLHSMPRLNPVLSHRTFLAALSNEAQIILEDGCGLSGATLVCVNRIHIGKNTLIGADSLLMDTDMHYPLTGSTWGGTQGRPECGKPIHIGDGCFIGARAIILKGVTIGNGAVVAAGAVVTRDVPSGYLAIGNPAVNKLLPDHLKHPDALYHTDSQPETVKNAFRI